MILTETQAAIRDAVRDYAQEQLRPRSAAFEAAEGYPEGLFEELARQPHNHGSRRITSSWIEKVAERARGAGHPRGAPLKASDERSAAA